MSTGTPASWPWRHVLGLRASQALDDPLPAPLPESALRVRRDATDPGSGWRATLLSGRRPGSRPAQHDWVITLTDPHGTTAALVDQHSDGRYHPDEVFAVAPGMGGLLKAPSAREKAQRQNLGVPASPDEVEAAFWRNARTLHAFITDPTRWFSARTDFDGPALRTALRWVSSGIATESEAEDWDDLDLAPAEALDGQIPWHAVGFSPDQARDWLPIHSDRIARDWADAGRTPAEAQAWARACATDTPALSPQHFARLEGAGWDPTRIRALFEAVDATSRGGVWTSLNTYLGYVLWDHIAPDQPQTRPWQALDPPALLRYLAAGITDLDEIDRFLTSPAPPSAADLRALAALRGTGVPPDLLSLSTA